MPAFALIENRHISPKLYYQDKKDIGGAVFEAQMGQRILNLSSIIII
jgi:hypothetical protein